MKNIKLYIATLVTFFAFHSPIIARDWPNIKGWEVHEIDNTSCITINEFEGKGNSKIAILKYINGDSVFLFDNENWSIEKDKQYFITFEIDKSAFIPEKFALGYGDIINRGIAIEINKHIFEALFKGSSINIIYWPGITQNDKYPDNDKEDPLLIDSLSLFGSGAAIGQLERCLDHIRNVSEADRREKQKFDHLPNNPFAN